MCKTAHTHTQTLVLGCDAVLTLLSRLQPKLTPQEKLKLRMQKALNKQCECGQFLKVMKCSNMKASFVSVSHLFSSSHFAAKADKKAAQEKIQQQEHKRQVCFSSDSHPEAPFPKSCTSLHWRGLFSRSERESCEPWHARSA